MRVKDPRPEPDIEWLGLAADIDGRSIVARSCRHIANAILADQSGADHGEAAQGHKPTWLPLRGSSRAHGHTTALRASHRHNQAMSQTSATVEPA